MKKAFEQALKSKQVQRQRNAQRPIEEKLKVLDRLQERSKLLRGAKPTKDHPHAGAK